MCSNVGYKVQFNITLCPVLWVEKLNQLLEFFTKSTQYNIANIANFVLGLRSQIDYIIRV